MLAIFLAAAAASTACSSAPARATHLSSGCTNSREIALTFDDGPNPPATDQILDLLAAAGARATFFAEGQATGLHPEVVRREIALGMSVGSHSYAHGADLPTMSHHAFADDLLRAERELAAALPETPRLYRSPFGHTSNTMLEEERKRGYISIGWDIDSQDWSDATVDQVVSNVLDQAHPGAIVLMHDGGLGGGNPDRSSTLAALPQILAGLRDREYRLVTVPEIIGLTANKEPHCSAT